MSRELVYGSTALSSVHPRWKKPKDYDVLIPVFESTDKVHKNAGAGVLNKNPIWYQTASRRGGGFTFYENRDIKFIPNHIFDHLEKYHSHKGVVTPYGIYNIKISHSFWNVKWAKTTKDILTLQETCGFRKTDVYLVESLREYWETVHGSKKHIKLDKPTEMFFKDSVKRKYNHDSIHEAIKYHHIPWHEALRTDKSKVYIPRANFESLTYDEKLEVCREEIYVTALERFWIGRMLDEEEDSDRKRYKEMFSENYYREALKKLVTTMTKGWFPLFIMENLIDLKEPDIDYIEKFHQNIDKYKGD